jgi:1-acyl-sn-glycerol-3-phosphate acyltransferase
MNQGNLTIDRPRSIRRFLDGQVLLITGTTGLLGKAILGKAIVEKILRCCPEVRRVYLLIRTRSGQASAEEAARSRMEREIISAELFDPLRKQLGPRFDDLIAEKLVAVPGDLSMERLGLSESWWERLAAEVDIFINSAATVVFDERLDLAVELNTLGPVRLLELAQAARTKVFLHVSTAYTSGCRSDRVPAAPVPKKRAGFSASGNLPTLPADIQGTVEQLLEESRRIAERVQRPANGSGRGADRWDRQLRQRLVDAGMAAARAHGWNDTYTFTKALGEHMVMEHRGDLPTVILRPAIIESSLCEPLPGWIDGMRMADPLIIAYGRRALSMFPADPNIAIDFIPLDFVVNSILSALPKADQEELRIFHVATSSENPLSFRRLVEYTHDYFVQNPMRDKAGRPIRVRAWPFTSLERFEQGMQRRRHQVRLLQSWLRKLPGTRGLVARLGAMLSGLDRLEHFSRIYGPYARLDIQFDTTQTRELYEALSREEQELFPFDVSRIEWRHYIQDVHIPGLMKNVLKLDEEDDQPFMEVEVGEKSRAKRKLLARRLSHSHWRGALAAEDSACPGFLRRSLFQNAARWVAWSLNRLLLCGWFRLKVIGAGYLPSQGPLLIASNHTSHLDYAALFAASGAEPSRAYALGAKDYFFKSRFRAMLFKALNVLPFDRRGNFVEDLQVCCRAVEHGHALIVFPEGTRSVTGELQAFKPGIGMLALETGVPIVPAYIDGAFEALPKGAHWPRRHPVTVRFGPPLEMAAYQERRGEISNHRLYREIVEELRLRVEALRG